MLCYANKKNVVSSFTDIAVAGKGPSTVGNDMAFVFLPPAIPNASQAVKTSENFIYSNRML